MECFMLCVNEKEPDVKFAVKLDQHTGITQGPDTDGTLWCADSGFVYPGYSTIIHIHTH